MKYLTLTMSSTFVADKPDDDLIDIVINENQDNEIMSRTPDTVIIDSRPEPDNLLELDKTEIKPLKSKAEELARIFRALPGLTPVQIRIIELRYLVLLTSYTNRLYYIDFFHHFTRSFVSLGSVAVPALLSIQSPTSLPSVGLFWATWALSLSITCLHNFVTIFRFEKKYFGLHATYEKLQSEGWYYLELSGRYSGTNGFPSNPLHRIRPTHQNQFTLFVHTIEKIQHRQITDEYNAKQDEKLQESIKTDPNTKSILSPESQVSPIKKI